MASYRQVPAGQGKKHTFIEEKRKRPLVNRVHGFSLAESQPGEESFFFPLHSALVMGHKACPFWPPNSLLLRFMFINFFY